MHRIKSSVHFARQTSRMDPAGGEGDWVPNTDVYTTDEGLVIKVELAGMRREDLSLCIEENRLRISGNRPDGCRAPKCNFLVMEINYGRFENVIEIPSGYDLSRATAAYVNGFLRIDIPLQQTERNGHSSTGRGS
ncbi:MAG: Hsp20/alpha crystallin family protein [Verrucomicrobiae bacterium]|nr:Hsp20/alpha crystallin family protein [Verrucomicrobiae bacterium]